MLCDRYDVTAGRVDAGGGLNGALLRAGLADEISVVVAPYLAAGASAGQPALIPGSMGTFSYMLAGIEGGGAFYSTCHGAGRVMSRHQALCTSAGCRCGSGWRRPASRCAAHQRGAWPRKHPRPARM